MVHEMDFEVMRQDTFDHITLSQSGGRKKKDLSQKDLNDEFSFDQKKGSQDSNDVLFNEEVTIQNDRKDVFSDGIYEQQSCQKQYNDGRDKPSP
jgi:hypothetical protein